MNNNVKLVAEIIEKIKVLPLNTETTVSELISYNPEQYFVEPLIQGQIINAVEEICRKENIYIERNKDEKGGLAFYGKFKKIENKNAEIVINEIVNYIINMNVGEKSTIKSIYEHIIDKLNIADDMDLLNVQNQVETMCENKGIILDYSAYDGQIVGVPYSLEFVKKIVRKDECMDNEFKINNNISFENEETKAEYQKYLDEINEYNRKIANGEIPEKDLSAITDKFKQKFILNHKLDNNKVELYDEFKNWVKKKDNDNNVYFTCHSDIIGKIDFCKSYNPNIIKINNECLKELKNDNFNIKNEIVIDLDNMRVDLDYVNKNSENFKYALEKLFEIKNDLLNEIFSQTLSNVIDWWDNDKDENGDTIDIEYIKKCLDSIDIEISVEDKDIYINVSFGIEGLNGEDFLGSHILSALIESRDNYKIEFNVE